MEDPYFQAAEDKFYNRSNTAARVLRVIKHQTGKTNVPVDKKITAMRAGKRISKTGNVYWETRKNRTDVVPKNKI
jgi:hypothetical protein